MNKNEKKVEMPVVPAAVRIQNYTEVATGYTLEMALEEADRCLDCKNPKCIAGCPVNVKINEFIRALKEGEMQKAYDLIYETNAFPSVCGRVCPQETQCEAKCIVGIKKEPVAIGRLERFVGDWFLQQGKREETLAPSTCTQVSGFGSGPAGSRGANASCTLG